MGHRPHTAHTPQLRVEPTNQPPARHSPATMATSAAPASAAATATSAAATATTSATTTKTSTEGGCATPRGDGGAAAGAAAAASPTSADKHHTTQDAGASKATTTVMDAEIIMNLSSGYFPTGVDGVSMMQHLAADFATGVVFAIESRIPLTSNTPYAAAFESASSGWKPGDRARSVKYAAVVLEARKFVAHDASMFDLRAAVANPYTSCEFLVTGKPEYQAVRLKNDKQADKSSIPAMAMDKNGELHRVTVIVWANVRESDYPKGAVVRVFGVKRDVSQFSTTVTFVPARWALVQLNVNTESAVRLKEKYACQMAALASVQFVFSDPSIRVALMASAGAVVDAAAEPARVTVSSSSSSSGAAASSSSSRGAASRKKAKVADDDGDDKQ